MHWIRFRFTMLSADSSRAWRSQRSSYKWVVSKGFAFAAVRRQWDIRRRPLSSSQRSWLSSPTPSSRRSSTSRDARMPPIISIRDLVAEYDGRRVLDGLNLDIEQGETMVLLGGSGSGKSTLLRHIIGLQRPRSGQLIIKGTDIARCSRAELQQVRRSIGVAFQSAALFNSFSLEDNIALPLRE